VFDSSITSNRITIIVSRIQRQGSDRGRRAIVKAIQIGIVSHFRGISSLKLVAPSLSAGSQALECGGSVKACIWPSHLILGGNFAWQ
jgi:hypothetical protein